MRVCGVDVWRGWEDYWEDWEGEQVTKPPHERAAADDALEGLEPRARSAVASSQHVDRRTAQVLCPL